MEKAIDRYKELKRYLGLERAMEEFEMLPEEKRKQYENQYSEFLNMNTIFNEMMNSAIDFEFLKEMLLNDKIALNDDFSITYEEYINKPRTNCLMTKFEYEEMRRILYGRNSTN